MAWPIAGPSSAGDTHPPIHPPQDPRHSQKPIKARLRRRRAHAPRQAPPSPGLLSLLASIAASSVTAGCSPTPPAFLCPFLSTLQPEELVRRDNEAFLDIAVDPNPQAPTPTKRRNKRHLPDRFQRGDDGRYRILDSYTLYGSTVCSSCGGPTITSTSSLLDPVDETDSSHDIDLSTLPTGWVPKQARESRTTTLIISLSLVLAFVICFLIISCLFWRKSRARKYRENDVEMKALRQRKEEGDEAVVAQQQAKSKQKLWARATARWKANARYTARQRRGRRSVFSRSAILANSSTSLPGVSDGPLASTSSTPAPSRSPSRRSSISCALPPSATSNSLSVESPVEVQTVTSIPDVSVSPPSPVPASPPAYQQPLPRTQSSISSLNLSDSQGKSPHFSSDSRRSSISGSLADGGRGLILADEALSYTPSIIAAHVATDDKALLARLGEMVSEPPSDSVGPSTLEVSAPTWQDETLDDFARISEGGVSAVHSAASPAFSTSRPGRSSSGFPLPPPPVSLKGKMADLSYYEYSYTYDDLAEVEGVEPSAPPFDEALGPSAPPLEDGYLEQIAAQSRVPSAPPLSDDLGKHVTEEESDRHSDGDSTDSVLEYVDEEDVPDSSHSLGTSVSPTPCQVQATVASRDATSCPPSPLPPPTSADYPRHRVSLIESTQDLVLTNDNVPLPRYQP